MPDPAKVREAFEAALAGAGLSVEDDIREYLADICQNVLEEAADGPAAAQDLREAIEPQLEDAGAGDAQLQAICAAVAAAAFPAAASAAPAGAAKPAGGPGAAGNGKDDSDLVCQIKDLLLMYGGSSKALLSHTMLELRRNRRYGIVGQNGAGKTTLFQALLSGAVKELPSHLSIVHVHGGSVMEAGDPEQSAVAFAMQRQKELGVRVGSVEDALKEVGFASEMQGKALRELSGGWRMRLALACAMMKQADVLLLDEPTNHLDTAAVQWLSQYCSKLKGTCLIISHEPEFLDAVCTDIMHFDQQKLNYYNGNFSFFLSKTALSDEEAQAVLETNSRPSLASAGKAIQGHQEDTRLVFPIPGKLEGITSTTKPILEGKDISFAYSEQDRMVLQHVGAKLSLSSRVAVIGSNGAGKSTLLSVLCGELAAVEFEGTVGEITRHRNLRLSYIAQQHTFHLEEFMKCTPVHYFQIRFKDGYDEQLQKRLKDPGSEEERQLRKDLAAKHGKYGKEVRDIVGRQKRGKEVVYEVAWEGLDDAKQNTFEPVSKLRLMHVDGLARAFDERHAAQASGAAERPLTEREIKQHLENFQFTEDMCTKRMISGFSGGQKARLMLGAAYWTRPHVIALDEPTNYLDPETVDQLTRALRSFRGGLITVTHSQHLIDEVCTETWTLADGKITAAKHDGAAAAKDGGGAAATTPAAAAPAAAKAKAKAADADAPPDGAADASKPVSAAAAAAAASVKKEAPAAAAAAKKAAAKKKAGR